MGRRPTRVSDTGREGQKETDHLPSMPVAWGPSLFSDDLDLERLPGPGWTTVPDKEGRPSGGGARVGVRTLSDDVKGVGLSIHTRRRKTPVRVLRGPGTRSPEWRRKIDPPVYPFTSVLPGHRVFVDGPDLGRGRRNGRLSVFYQDNSTKGRLVRLLRKVSLS